ncbi:rhamnan synthesis F family protein [Agreia sp. COWG]|uniref:rhamnan synthesis F family protein n=1 Tax=Agreia sp. COWG TaxID=2773266 RepID=UPI0019261594|nr:rhamnan synthesis F family protein [Agreia sp. COWG]CAD5993322.1 Alpha-L-Rha alpha-1,2-L-rhamnosyltransferase/alpha-L-Rha alpha-1,3-L-rhamnosyltransferase [Agreia sp. COWG]
MRRIVFYMFYDPQGQVDDYVSYKLEQLKRHSEHIVVISNSPLQPESRLKLEQFADDVWERENVGFDVGAYKEALERFGSERLSQFDELILMNYTFFGPIGSFDPLFAEMDARPLDFWGVTEHGEVVPHPRTGVGSMPRHIQSHWIAVRRSLFTTDAFRNYWADMPVITSYDESIDRHEAYFTPHFSGLGYTFDVAYPEADYPSLHPIFDNAEIILRDGCPILKRRIFFHDPLYLDRKGILGKDILDVVEARGYPIDLIFSNVVRSTQPRILKTNFSLLEVLPEQDLGYDASKPLKVAAVAHIFYESMVDEMVDRFETLPDGFDLIITTSDETKKAAIEQSLAARGRIGDVRVVASNAGRDISAFFVGCRDVIENDDYDLIVKLHSKKSLQDDYNVGTLFKRHLFENLLSSPGYTANVLHLFQQHASLGMVFPPVIHMGYPTLGHAWFGNRDMARRVAKRLGITVPFDQSTPLSPYGSMFMARPAALRSITAAGYDYADFPDEEQYGDGSLSHVLERLASYAALNSGFHVREVLNTRFAGIYYSFLEYKLQAISHYLPGTAEEQVAVLSTPMPEEPTLSILKQRFIRRSPALGTVLRPAYHAVRSAFRSARAVARRRVR